MKLNTHIAVISILVEDQEDALHFYTKKLGLEKRSDISFGPGLRLLTVAPKGQRKPEIALAKPDIARLNEEDIRALMEQNAQNNCWVFDTENCRKMYAMLAARGVKFVHVPTQQFYGIEATFEDPYGNKFTLLEASQEVRSLLDHCRVGTAA